MPLRLFPSLDAVDAFSEFEQLLVSNCGENAFDVAMQLLTAKLYAERRKPAAPGCGDFSADGDPDSVHRRISTLYKQAIAEWPELGSADKEIRVPAHTLIHCLAPLVGWQLLESDLSHLDGALERLVARDAKGSLGQYFTPREVIRMCVAALCPSPTDSIIDPACGSGAFLYEAIRYCSHRSRKVPHCFGLDLGERSIRVARLLARAAGTTSFQVIHGNALDGRHFPQRAPKEWAPFVDSVASTQDRAPWGAWHDLRCSVLLTNPPFAGDIEDATVLAAYESQRLRRAARKGGVSREHLFVERAVQLLSPGGRLAIVVPQGVLANTSAGYLREWLMSQCRLLAVVGLHQYTFLPYTGVKTAVLFLEKRDPKDKQPSEYPVAFITSRQPGKDSSGRITQPSDYASIGNTLARFFSTHKRPWARPPEADDRVPLEVVTYSEVAAHGRLDSEYYDPEVRDLYHRAQKSKSGTVGDLVARRIERFNRTDFKEIEYVDISSIDESSGIPVPERCDASEAPSRASYVLEVGDILISTVRPERNVVGMFTGGSELPCIASNGFCVLRARQIPPELLFAFCKTKAFRKLLARKATASMYPAVTDRDVLEMPFLPLADDVAQSVVKSIKEGLRMMAAARAAIAAGIKEIDSAVDNATNGGSQDVDAPSKDSRTAVPRGPRLSSSVEKTRNRKTRAR